MADGVMPSHRMLVSIVELCIGCLILDCYKMGAAHTALVFRLRNRIYEFAAWYPVSRLECIANQLLIADPLLADLGWLNQVGDETPLEDVLRSLTNQEGKDGL